MKKNSGADRQVRKLDMAWGELIKAFPHAYFDCGGVLTKTAKKLKINFRTAQRLAEVPAVQDEYKKICKRALRRYKKGGEDVLEEMAVLAFSDPGNLFERDGLDGIKIRNLLDMGPERRAIKKIKHTKRDIYNLAGEISATVHEYIYELHDKIKPLEKLGEYHDLWNQKDKAPEDQGKEKSVRVYLPDNGRMQSTDIVVGVRFGAPEKAKPVETQAEVVD